MGGYHLSIIWIILSLFGKYPPCYNEPWFINPELALMKHPWKIKVWVGHTLKGCWPPKHNSTRPAMGREPSSPWPFPWFATQIQTNTSWRWDLLLWLVPNPAASTHVAFANANFYTIKSRVLRSENRTAECKIDLRAREEWRLESWIWVCQRMEEIWLVSLELSCEQSWIPKAFIWTSFSAKTRSMNLTKLSAFWIGREPGLCDHDTRRFR